MKEITKEEFYEYQKDAKYHGNMEYDFATNIGIQKYILPNDTVIATQSVYNGKKISSTKYYITDKKK